MSWLSDVWFWCWYCGVCCWICCFLLWFCWERFVEVWVWVFCCIDVWGGGICWLWVWFGSLLSVVFLVFCVFVLWCVWSLVVEFCWGWRWVVWVVGWVGMLLFFVCVIWECFLLWVFCEVCLYVLLRCGGFFLEFWWVFMFVLCVVVNVEMVVRGGWGKI